MGEKNNPHGRRSRPLTKDEIEALDIAAQGASDDLAALTTRILQNTGLRREALHHAKIDVDEDIKGIFEEKLDGEIGSKTDDDSDESNNDD